MARIASKSELGARGLKTLIENTLLSVMYRAPELRKQGVHEIEFHKYPVEEENFPLFKYDNGQTVIDTNYKIYRGIYGKQQ